MRTAVFVQVRMGSTRLPRKALLPLKGMSVIRHVMRALQGIPADIRALVTDQSSAAAFEADADAEGFGIFVGSPLDVLDRYCAASRTYSADRIIRATGDNPLVSASLACEIMALHKERGADLSHFLGCPWGMGVEVVEADALHRADREAKDPVEREHITTYIYRHPESFVILEPQAPSRAHAPEARVTVDTPEDYRRMERIFSDLYHGEPLEAEEVIGWFAREDGTRA